MKTTLKTLLISAAIILPISAFAADTTAKPDTQKMQQQCMKGQPCPMAEDMGKMQSQMGDMMAQMQSMMGMTKDKNMMDSMQKMHGQMGDMMKNMQEMHKNMGMMDGMDMGTTKEKPAQDSQKADPHHPKK